MRGLIHPVIGRELLRELRRSSLYGERFFVAVVGSWLGMMSIIFGGDLEFHQILFIGGGAFASWKTLSLTMSTFAEERRNGTLELLFLAGLSAWEVFLMKLIGGMARVAMHLIGILPFQAFPFLAGGLSAELFVATIAVLVLWTFFVFAAGAFGSALCREDEHALAVAWSLIGGIGALPLIATYGGAFFSAPAAFSAAAVSADWLLICPGYLAVLVLDQLRSFSAAEVWDAGLATLGWGAALLLVAFRMVGVGGQEDRTVVERLRSRLAAARRWGSSLAGRRLRGQWLDKDPSAWLVLRDRDAARLMWSFLGVLGFLASVFCWFWGTVWIRPGVIYLLAVVCLVGLSWLSLYTVGRRIGEDRRSGVLELLLTTGLSPREIVEGQRRGVRRMFWPVVMGVFRVLFLLSLGSLLLRGEVGGWAWSSFLLAWIVLSGFLHGVLNADIRVMWISLNSARPALAVFKAFGEFGGIAVGMLPSLFMFGGELLIQFLIQFPSGLWLEWFFICAVGLTALVTILVNRYLFGWKTIEKRLIAEFRSIAAEPVPEKSDPRFKYWDATKRLSENRPLRWRR